MNLQMISLTLLFIITPPTLIRGCDRGNHKSEKHRHVSNKRHKVSKMKPFASVEHVILTETNYSVPFSTTLAEVTVSNLENSAESYDSADSVSLEKERDSSDASESDYDDCNSEFEDCNEYYDDMNDNDDSDSSEYDTIESPVEDPTYLVEICKKAIDGSVPHCVGTIISVRFVLSLESCVRRKHLKMAEIHVGLSSLTNHTKRYNIQIKLIKSYIALYKTFIDIQVEEMAKLPQMININDNYTLYTLTKQNVSSQLVSLVVNTMCLLNDRRNKLCFTGMPCFLIEGSPIINRKKNAIVAIYTKEIVGVTSCMLVQTTAGMDVSMFKNWIKKQIAPLK